jgi:carbonic anhydrase/acetyltransferase-like protein (isoleucine patch superfamily)
MIKAFMGIMPAVADSAFIADSAEVIGDVVIGDNSSIWFGAIIRGDTHYIRIGERTNIQDRCVLHVDYGKNPVLMGHEITVGHGALIHGCTIKDCAMIGMGAIILSGALISEECIVGAGALIPQGAIIPPRSVVMGSPAKIKRSVTHDEIMDLRKRAQDYFELSRRYLTGELE